MTISLTTDSIYTALREYISLMLDYPPDKVRRAYVDNIPPPASYPYCYATVLRISRNATNVAEYEDNAKRVSSSQILDVQLDFYGQDGFDDANIIKTIFRDEVSVDFFKSRGLVPLYSDDIEMSGETDDNENWRVRNILTLHFNIHPSVILPQDFAESLEIENEGL